MKVLSFPDFRAANPYQALLADAVAEQGSTIVHVRGYKRVLPILRAVSQEPGVGVLHIHWLHPYMRGKNTLMRMLYACRFVLELQILRWRGIGIIWTVHNLESHDSVTPKLERWLSKQMSRLSNRMFAHSEDARSAIIEVFGADPNLVSVVPHGSYEKVYGAPISKEEARRQMGISTHVPVIMFFGLIRPYKNVLKILAAWPGVKAGSESARLLLCGAAPDQIHRSEIERLASQLEDVTLDFRFIPNNEVAAHFCAADVMVLPFAKSLTSGTVSLAETYGTPVVVPEVVGTRRARNATISKSVDANDLADAISSALEARATRPASAPVTVSWVEIAKVHVEAYKLAGAE